MLALPPHTPKVPSYITRADELLRNEITEIPKLIDPIFQKVGVVAVTGSSDTGKSSLLRQLAMDIVSGKEAFIGFPIKATHRSVLYISTEDDNDALSCTLKMQNIGNENPDDFKGLRFIFDTDSLHERIEHEIQSEPVDAIIIDAFSDIFSDDMNRANQVRTFIQDYSNWAVKHRCLVIFLHHTSKRAEDNPPSKHNMLGSQGFEAKSRVVIELRKDFQDPSGTKRHFCIVKGNYLAERFKNSSYVLNFSDTLTFNNTGERVDFEELSPQSGRRGNTEVRDRAIELRRAGNTIDQILAEMVSEGLRTSRSAIGNYVQGITPGN